MTEYRCKSCDGLYYDKDSAGLRYFHACSPVVNKDGQASEIPNKRDENIGKQLPGKGVDKIG